MMTGLFALVGAASCALAVHLAWPADPLRRLADVPRLALPAWLRPKPSSLPTRLRALAGGGAGAAVVVLLGGPPLLPLATGAAVGTVIFWGLGRLETGGAAATRADLVAELPGALDILAACVASGMPLRSATSAVAGAVGGLVGERLGSVVGRTATGFGDSDAWAVLREDDVLGPLARDLARASEAGTAMGTLLARHAEAARAAAQGEALARARAVGVRTIIPVSVCYRPAFVLLGVVPVIAGVLGSILG
ncbi:MAG: type II secretion system F family protein [Actinobacteria bacterium]|nr:type II secretion system F family protein [Actinomycetota bacterium]